MSNDIHKSSHTCESGDLFVWDHRSHAKIPVDFPAHWVKAT